MLIEKRQQLRTVPAPPSIPLCSVTGGKPYGLFFAYRKDSTRPAPGTNYIYAMQNWAKLWL